MTLSAVMMLVGLAMGHPTKYHVNRNETCVKPNPAPIFSYHIHLLYWQNNAEHTKGAYEIRDAMREAMSSALGPDCHDLFHNDVNCFLDPDTEAAGPFLTA